MTAHGKSKWTNTQQVVVRHPDGHTKSYFLKSCSADVGRVMMEGEFTSLRTMHDSLPTLVPRPFGWGKLESAPGTHFLLMDFLELGNTLPGPVELAQVVAELHGCLSPDGKFGFPVHNCHGEKVQEHYSDDNWCRYFTNLITAFFEEDIRVNGPCPELEHAFETLCRHVIPRLLGPLQADGRTLTPRLVHGDLWQGNIGTDAKTGRVVVYDPAAWYAHHEYEYGTWRCAFNGELSERYVRECVRLFPASEPAGEFDDRNRLYSLKFNISHSFHWVKETVDTRKR